VAEGKAAGRPRHAAIAAAAVEAAVGGAEDFARLIRAAARLSRSATRQGFAVFCLWTAVLMAAAAFLLRRRDA